MLALDPVLLPFELAGQGDLYHSVQLGLPAVRRVPAVLTIHDLAPLHWPSQYLRLPYARVGHAWQYALAKRADAIVAVSEATKADIVARLSIPAERIRVIPEAVDASFAPPARDVAAVVGDAGLLVDERDPSALGEALVTLLGDDALRARLGGRAKPRAARFSWDRAADNTLAVYRSLR